MSGYKSIIASPDQYLIIKNKDNFLGEGSFGEVYLGVDNETQEKFAIKFVNKKKKLRNQKLISI